METGIYSNGTLNINNSTITGNKALGNGGGIFHTYSTLVIKNSTIVNNSALDGGGGLSTQVGYVYNTIIADNSTLPSSMGSGCSGILNISKSSLFGSLSGCSIQVGSGNQANVEPLLSQVAIGMPAYHELKIESPAINAGDPATCLPTDQEG
ncbi:MAG: choice-of-anchor Q domain-containing protein [Anaerolineales bacterium]